MAAYDALRDLPLRIESADTDRLTLDVSSEFTRVTTIVRLRGGGEEGLGEDVTYDADAHRWFPQVPVGGYTIGSFSSALDGIELFASPASQDAWLDYRRWSIESAALDLALRQAATTLGELLGREPEPVRFVVSTRATELEPLLALYPSTRFKLDARPTWTDDFVAALAAQDIVDCVDLKGAYQGTAVDAPPDAELYRRVAEHFPRAWIEDPALTPETSAALEPYRDRITWDAPIHSWADVEALPFAPRCLNCKPSRFGTVERLFEFYDRCAEHGIALYGGGQFELGVGRPQIQLLAALSHPAAPNDVAPAAYNAPQIGPGLPTSPLRLDVEPGFRAKAPADTSVSATPVPGTVT